MLVKETHIEVCWYLQALIKPPCFGVFLVEFWSDT